MEYTIQALVKGDPEIAHHYARGAKRWLAILRAEASLAMRLRIEQLWFEKHCGGRYLGQEVMAVTGIAHLYTTADGFGDNQEPARRVSDAIQASTCSAEVKGVAERMAHLYLDEELGSFRKPDVTGGGGLRAAQRGACSCPGRSAGPTADY